MKNENIIRILNVVAVIAATIGGASAVPDLNLPKVVLAYGLFVAMVCKAVAAELVQVKGQSDEAQGITPPQMAVKANADAVVAAHAVPPTTTTTTTVASAPVETSGYIAPVAKPLVALLLCLGCISARAQTNTNLPVVAAPTNLYALPVITGVGGIIEQHLIDDLPYITNKTVSADVAVLFNKTNPKGTGHVGEYADVVFPMTQQSEVGIGFGNMAHHEFVTPITLTLGTTLTNLPAVLGRWYMFTSDGMLYDLNGHSLGNWAAAGVFHSWTINKSVSIGVKCGAYDDSVVPGIGWFGALTGTF